MTGTSDIRRPIVETLYTEALTLADEVRAAFDFARANPARPGDDEARLAMSVEGLRTTTRIMHVLAWLLNQRAYFSGDLSEFQLRRHGTLPADRPAEADQLAHLEPEMRALIAETERIHRRVARLDAAWRAQFAMQPAAVLRLRERLGREVGRMQAPG